MKMIIDIPEELYEHCVIIKIKSDEQIAIVNGTPFDSFIEDIKAEIEDLDADYDFEGFYQCQNAVLAIIDKHISKAESEE